MPVPDNHTLIPITKSGLEMLEMFYGKKFTVSNKKNLRGLHLHLRHSNDIDNCDTGGLFPVNYIIGDTLFNTSIDKLVNTVYNNNKNRFQFSISNNELYIRANQGHSGAILEKIIPEHIYEIYTSDDNIFHRTTEDISNIIFSSNNEKNGLRVIGRLIHMANSEDLARSMDHYPVKIMVNVKKARRLGITFYRSSNNVFLSYANIPLSCLYLGA